MIQYMTSSGTPSSKFCLLLKNQWEALTHTFFFSHEKDVTGGSELSTHIPPPHNSTL